MALLTAYHRRFKYGPDNTCIGCIETVHFTRTQMAEYWAEFNRRENAMAVSVYQSEFVTIVEYTYV